MLFTGWGRTSCWAWKLPNCGRLISISRACSTIIMTWLWLTFFSALPLLSGTVTGRVELRDSRDPAVRKRLDYSGVVVSLHVSPARPFLGEGRATILQNNKTFTPHVLAVPVGTSVEFPNADPIFHNAFSSYSGQIFDVGLYPPGSTRAVRFTRPGIVRVF